jgi:C-terminal processing protease CtpA/Prc
MPPKPSALRSVYSPLAVSRPVALCLLLSLCLTTALIAQTTRPAAQPAGPATASDLIPDAVLAELDHNDYEVRQRTTRRLLSDDRITPEIVALRYPKATTLEQRQRLLDVARHHLVRRLQQEKFKGALQASIGLTQMGVPAEDLPDLGRPAIRVLGTFPGFPAYAQLQDGDLILAVDDRRVTGAQPAEIAQGFTGLVQTRQAGQAVNLTIHRGGKTLQMRVVLASMDALQQMYDPGSSTLKPPFRQEWDDYEAQLNQQTAAAPPLNVDANAPPATAPAP